MPWRKTDDPYRIWVSEVMLQQTRVDQAEPYYHRFLDAFPTVEALAEAELDEVLRCWEGLGYYSRARYLHKAAKTVAEKFGGCVPDSYEAIRSLPGVGPYTASAVLSIAFGKPHAVLDGNVIRVLTRVFAIDDVVSSTRTRRTLQVLADELLEPSDPGTFNQALMELGATRCRPSLPRCPSCPLQAVCAACEAGDQAAYPVKKKKAPIPHHDVAVGLIEDAEGRLLIQKRPREAMLGGLWEFPGGKREDGEAVEAACRRELREELGIEVEVGGCIYQLDHAYSHFKITLHAFECQLLAGTPTSALPLEWAAIDELGEYAFPRANRRLIEHLQERQDQPTLFDH